MPRTSSASLGFSSTVASQLTTTQWSFELPSRFRINFEGHGFAQGPGRRSGGRSLPAGRKINVPELGRTELPPHGVAQSWADCACHLRTPCLPSLVIADARVIQDGSGGTGVHDNLRETVACACQLEGTLGGCVRGGLDGAGAWGQNVFRQTQPLDVVS